MSENEPQPKTYWSIAVANSFLELAKKKGQQLDPMKLLKLVYFAHGWYLALYDKPLIDEHVQAWDYGPVIPTVYREFKQFGSNPIKKLVRSFDGENFFTPMIPAEDEFAWDFLEEVWRIYGDYSGVQLSNISHEDGSPWHSVRSEFKGRGVKSVRIDHERIRQYFKGKLNSNSPND